MCVFGPTQWGDGDGYDDDDVRMVFGGEGESQSGEPTESEE